MTPTNRRNILKGAGIVIGAGGIISSRDFVDEQAVSTASSTGLTAAEEHSLPRRGPYSDEDWVETRSGPGNTGTIDTAPDVDPDRHDCTLFYEGEYHSEPIVVDGTMYLTDDDGITALNVRDGSVRWTQDVDGAGGLAAAYQKLVSMNLRDDQYVLTAHDIEDGNLIWERELDRDRPSLAPRVGYETVYVGSDGVTYAIDIADGSSRWETEVGHHGLKTVYDGMVYTGHADFEHAGHAQLVALDAFTGDEQWRVEEKHFSNITATGDRVSNPRPDGDRTFYHPKSGEELFSKPSPSQPAHDEEVFVVATDSTLRAYFLDSGGGWEVGDFLSGSISNPTIAGDEVYVYIGDGGSEYDYSLVSFDKTTGDVNWSQEIYNIDGIRIVATSDAVYVCARQEIHAVHDIALEREYCEATFDDDEEQPTPTADESTPASTPEQSTATPTADESTATPNGADSVNTAEDEPASPTKKDEVSPTNDSSSPDGADPTAPGRTPTDENVAPVVSSPTGGTEESTADGPGLGITSTVTGIGAVGYLIRRRLFDVESKPNGEEP